MNTYLQITTTVDKKEHAERIAARLVEDRLAACVQIVGPVTSVYHWKEAIETSEEWQLQIKTRASLYSPVEQAVREMHPYQVPELIALPIEQGSASYLTWIEENTVPTREDTAQDR